jgi:hypothetical protein
MSAGWQAPFRVLRDQFLAAARENLCVTHPAALRVYTSLARSGASVFITWPNALYHPRHVFPSPSICASGAYPIDAPPGSASAPLERKLENDLTVRQIFPHLARRVQQVFNHSFE